MRVWRRRQRVGDLQQDSADARRHVSFIAGATTYWDQLMNASAGTLELSALINGALSDGAIREHWPHIRRAIGLD